MENEKSGHRTYVRVFGATLSLALIALMLAAFYIQPLDGELTRLGFYAERDFGWNLPQRKLRGDARLGKEYQGYADVLIIGDSFSTNGVWQPFFQHQTGLSYLTLNIRETSITDLLASGPFRKHPPKILIVQSVERELLYFFANMDIPFDGNGQQDIRIPLKKLADQPRPEYYEDTRKTFDLRNINLRYAASVLVNMVMRNISAADSGSTKRFLLSNDTLFSNRRSRDLLIYEGDMNKLFWKKDDLEKAFSALRRLQAWVQSNGKTLFVFMLAPDKSTAYAEYMVTPEFRNIFQTNRGLEDHGINTPRIDLAIKAAIHRGEKDIYIPSGTHWSARGYELAAERMADYITARALSTP